VSLPEKERGTADKNNTKSVAYFLSHNFMVFRHHVYHAFHHDHTIKKPRSITTFSQKHPQKRLLTT